MNKKKVLLACMITALLGSSLLFFSFRTQRNSSYALRLARLKYNGGGDWYSSRTALKNLAQFCNANIKTNIDPSEATVEAASNEIFNYPYVFITGHGNISFSDAEAENLRMYMEAGGFLHICDNYGMDKHIRPQLKKVFPELELQELPFTHPVYHSVFNFARGMQKVHEHEGKAPQGFGLIYKGRLVCFYDFETDLGNGWEDAEVYNDPESVRQAALQMGANLIHFSFNQ